MSFKYGSQCSHCTPLSKCCAGLSERFGVVHVPFGTLHTPFGVAHRAFALLQGRFPPAAGLSLVATVLLRSLESGNLPDRDAWRGRMQSYSKQGEHPKAGHGGQDDEQILRSRVSGCNVGLPCCLRFLRRQSYPREWQTAFPVTDAENLEALVSSGKRTGRLDAGEHHAYGLRIQNAQKRT
jgi:hypothetical protein